MMSSSSARRLAVPAVFACGDTARWPPCRAHSWWSLRAPRPPRPPRPPTRPPCRLTATPRRHGEHGVDDDGARFGRWCCALIGPDRSGTPMRHQRASGGASGHGGVPTCCAVWTRHARGPRGLSDPGPGTVAAGRPACLQDTARTQPGHPARRKFGRLLMPPRPGVEDRVGRRPRSPPAQSIFEYLPPSRQAAQRSL